MYCEVAHLLRPDCSFRYYQGMFWYKSQRKRLARGDNNKFRQAEEFHLQVMWEVNELVGIEDSSVVSDRKLLAIYM